MRVTLIYLAAGNSRRFGESLHLRNNKKDSQVKNLSGNKLFFPIDGKPMYLHLLKRLNSICSRYSQFDLLVVTQYLEILETAKKLGVRAVFSPDSCKGASWSVKAGIYEVREADACVFFVADQPYLSEKTAESFLLYMQEKCPDGLGCVCFGQTTGNPVWFSRRFFGELLKLEGDRGGKKVLKEHWSEAEFFCVKNEAELQDIDVWEVDHL